MDEQAGGLLTGERGTPMTDGIRSRLLSDEQIIWEGKPDPSLIFRPIEVALIPFSIFWAGFAVFWNVQVWATPADLSFKLFGLPFLIAGLYVTFGRFLIDAQLRKATTYFVTNKHALIVRGRSGSTLKSIDLTRLPSLELDERSDGSGTIRFGPSTSLFSGMNSFGIWQPMLDPMPQFVRIPDVRSVYELIQTHRD
jgi:hypothetical protein